MRLQRAPRSEGGRYGDVCRARPSPARSRLRREGRPREVRRPEVLPGLAVGEARVVAARGVVFIAAGRRAGAAAAPVASTLGRAEGVAEGVAEAGRAAAAPSLCVLAEAHVLGEEAEPTAGRGVAGQQPEQGLLAEDGLDVADDAPVVGRGVVARPLHGLLAELDGRHGLLHQPDVEGEEDGDQESQEARQGLPKEQQEHRHEGRARIRRGLDRLHHRPDDEVAVHGGVEQQQEEVLVVLEAHAVIDPRAVVVHLEDAHAADPAVVAAVWLVLRAPLAVASVPRALGLLQAHREVPVDRDLLGGVLPGGVLLLLGDGARVNENALQVADDEEDRDEVEHHQLHHAHVVVVGVPVHGQAMEDGVDEVETNDVGPNKDDREEFHGLGEAVLEGIGGGPKTGGAAMDALESDMAMDLDVSDAAEGAQGWCVTRDNALCRDTEVQLP
eukprot:CAMPEP_0171283688 /NCGR_PEP_ID=MMETSP0790-20130122/67561_1 /TAXON_ID=2925 /ORGANISM="Alexandrium catenella, Strain OF101" /LENGTH=442 /DNA_ID=CAMNT_0011752979 /DNA_START=211 /DNA_END=1538 /DNA_ORIENTATION=+